MTTSTTQSRVPSRMRSGVALVDDSTTLDGMALADVVHRAAGAMQVAAGPGQRWAVLGENVAPTVIAHAAGLQGGTGTVAVARQLTVGELAYQFRESDAVAAIAPVELAETVARAAAESAIRLLVVHGPGDPGNLPVPTLRWPDWLATAPVPVPAASRPARPILVFTSGTTGRPKATAVRWAFGDFASAADYIAALSAPHTPAGAHLVAGPLQHNGPLTAVRHLLAGGAVVVLRKFDAEQALAAIDRYRVSSSVMVPTHLQRLLALPHEVKQRYDVSSMRLLAHTGAACPPAVKRAMIDWFGPVLVESYGGSEVGTLCRIGAEEWLSREGSVGRPAPPYTVCVRGEDGAELPPGATGLLCFRVPEGRGIEYLNDPEKTAAAYVEPGLVTLGDVGHVDTDGYVYVTDRVADMVVSGGVNLYPAESEQALAAHPQVADVAVIGVPHPDLGEQLLALVVPTDPADPPDPADLDTWCRDRLAAYKTPKSYEFVDHLPRTAMTKLDKRALRRPYWPDTRTVAG